MKITIGILIAFLLIAGTIALSIYTFTQVLFLKRQLVQTIQSVNEATQAINNIGTYLQQQAGQTKQ